MKLLSFSIPKNDQNIGFRSLKPEFKIFFHSELSESSMTKFSPFCFAGLNGSGKSNFIDALLFVFGFRSMKLREQNLQNLIHDSGDKKGKSCKV